MPAPLHLLMSTLEPSAAAAGSFTWADIASQVARWDANVPASITESTGVYQVADQVASYDLDIVADTETGPTYSSSDSIFGGAGSIEHVAGTDSLRAQIPDTSQGFTVWGVFTLKAATSSNLWNGGSSAPLCSVIEASQWALGDTTWTITSDGTNLLEGSDGFVIGGSRAVLVVAYFSGASSYIEVDGIAVTVSGSTVGTTQLTDLYVGPYEHRWSILGVVSGEISSGTRADMLALARSERGVDATWTPAALGPRGWWRADLGHALADTDPVTAWANQGWHADGDLSQGTSAKQPHYDASHASFNGQAVVDFDGGDVLYAAASSWWHNSDESSSGTLVAVARTMSASGIEFVVQTRQIGGQGGADLSIRAAGACRFRAYESGAGANISDNGANGVQNSVHVIAGVLTGAVSTSPDSMECWVDGVSAGATTGDLSSPVAAAADREWCVGGTSTTAGSLTGQIAELIYVPERVLTAAEDAALTTYLNTRYGLSLTGVTQ